MTRTRLSWANRIALAVALLFALFPIFWLLSTSFKLRSEYVSGAAVLSSWIPSSLSLNNYRDVFYPYMNLLGMPQTSSWRSLVSTTGVALSATTISVIFGLMAAIAFARYRVGGSWMPISVPLVSHDPSDGDRDTPGHSPGAARRDQHTDAAARDLRRDHRSALDLDAEELHRADSAALRGGGDARRHVSLAGPLSDHRAHDQERTGGDLPLRLHPELDRKHRSRLRSPRAGT